MFNDFQSWLASPFSPAMSVFGWFAFFGFAIACFAIWAILFNHIKTA